MLISMSPVERSYLKRKVARWCYISSFVIEPNYPLLVWDANEIMNWEQNSLVPDSQKDTINFILKLL